MNTFWKAAVLSYLYDKRGVQRGLQVSVNPGGAGVSSQLLLAGGGGGCLTSELIGGARSMRRRPKALIEGILMQSYNFLNKGKYRIKVRSKVKVGSYRLIGC